MRIESHPAAPGDLLFRWEPQRQRKLAIGGFLFASALLHALCFYLFQVVYPPAIALLPPPAQVSVIAPTSPEARSFLSWLDAEDPALASQTQRSPEARAFQLPKLAHIPSYQAVPPRLKEMPIRRADEVIPSAMPPAPVPLAPAAAPGSSAPAPSILLFADGLDDLSVTHPALKFIASTRDAPESARFRIAVDSLGAVRYVFLEQSSGDTSLDEQARFFLALSRFAMEKKSRPSGPLIWSTATVQFGKDVEMPPSAAERVAP